MNQIMIYKGNSCFLIGKKAISFMIFIIPVAIFLLCIPFLIKKNPPLTFIFLASLAITIIISSSGLLYASIKVERYFQTHDFHLWKKLKSCSLKDRMEAAKAINHLSTQVPELDRCLKHANKIAFILLTTWTIIFLICFSFIIFSVL
jgi:hypothetical protein